MCLAGSDSIYHVETAEIPSWNRFGDVLARSREAYRLQLEPACSDTFWGSYNGVLRLFREASRVARSAKGICKL
jgi:hypothetical protein